MPTPRKLRLAAVLLLSTTVTPVFAVSKEMVQLQTQIQQLQDAVARLQQSNDERMGVLKDLVQQSADSVNRMSVTVNTLQRQLAEQQGTAGAKTDQVAGQVSALNDSLDEIKARMARLEKVLASIDSQQQAMSASLQSMPAQGSAQPAVTSPVPAQTTPAAPIIAADATSAPTVKTKPAKTAAAPADELYRAAYTDYMAAKYAVSAGEFNDVIHAYPDNALSANSWYYLGEIDYRAGKFAVAARDYDKVLEQFPDSNKIPAAHLHKAQALLALKQQDAGVRELRALIQRFPTSPEATQARSRLSGMGVPVKPKA